MLPPRPGVASSREPYYKTKYEGRGGLVSRSAFRAAPRGAALALSALALAAAAHAAPRRTAAALDPARLGAPAASFRDATLLGPTLLGAAARGAFWGGAIVASNGEAVNLFLSEAYLPDESVRQAWADFVARLYHGSELAALRIYVAPLALIESMCGPGTGGCYSLSARAAMVPGEDLPDGTTKETVLAHELGHHVAASRDNYPWTAAEWGTKRWASYADVCARQAVGAAFPGDQGDNYHLNPGEAFAEVYRLLNFQALGLPAAIWNSDVSFYPDAAALEAARLDVVSPWTGATATSWSGRFGRPAPKKPPALKTKAKRRRGAGVVGFAPVTRTIQTPHDGVLTVTVGRAPPETLISLHDASGSELVPPTPGPISFTVCGQRTLSLAVTTSIAGDFRVTISTP